MMRIGIIIASVRSGRNGERVAQWVRSRLSARNDATAEMLDLIDYPLPLYDERELPSAITTYASDVANRWAAAVDACDGFIIVTPEYNHSFPAPLKNALDTLYSQWNDKPAGFVSYSTGAIGGARAVEQLRPVVGNLRLHALTEAVHLGKVQEVLSPEGVHLGGGGEKTLDALLEKTVAWAGMLRERRK